MMRRISFGTSVVRLCSLKLLVAEVPRWPPSVWIDVSASPDGRDWRAVPRGTIKRQCDLAGLR